MDSIYTNPDVSSTVAAFTGAEPQHQGISSNFLYQAATVLGMLLFLFSF